MEAIWQSEDRRLPRGHYVIPCVLRDLETGVTLKTVLLDLNGLGCRVFTNDRRVRQMDEKLLFEKTFAVEFDFYELDTAGIEGRIVNLHPGERPEYERQFGIEFTAIPPTTKRDINRVVRRDLLAEPGEHKGEPPGR